jgi:pimeloyl-ACP methyl ester carboxylesterase
MIKTTVWLAFIISISLYLLLLVLLHYKQEMLLFPAEVLSDGYVFDIPYAFEEVFIPVAGGEEIHALHIKQSNPKGVVFFLHGNAGSLRTWATGLDFYERVNYDLFILDYRGYGKSSGKITSQQQLVDDVRTAWNFISPQYLNKKKVIYGRSLGSGLATILAKNVDPDLLVLVSAYSSMADVAKEQCPFVPSWLLRYPLRTDEIISDITANVVFIHGSHDELISIDHSKKLHSLIKNKSTLISIEHAAHNDIHQFDDYLDELENALP